MTGDEIPERCAHPIIEGFPTDDVDSCHLPKGHEGMHAPLPVLWQMAGFADGPWNPSSRAMQRMRDVLDARLADGSLDDEFLDEFRRCGGELP